MKIGDTVELNTHAPAEIERVIQQMGSLPVGQLEAMKFVPPVGLACFVQWVGQPEATYVPFRYLQVVSHG